MKYGTKNYFLAWRACWRNSHLLEIFDRLKDEISNPQNRHYQDWAWGCMEISRQLNDLKVRKVEKGFDV